MFVVKRRRRVEPRIGERRSSHGIDEINGKLVVDYQTAKSFHREKLTSDGARRGEYGHIDPLGVRRVVEYATAAAGGMEMRKKENDFVGEDTYFQAIR